MFIAAVGLGREVRKFDIVTVRKETEMLASPEASLEAFPLTSNGLNARFAWYYISHFFSRGASELRNINSTQFELVFDDFNEEYLK